MAPAAGHPYPNQLSSPLLQNPPSAPQWDVGQGASSSYGPPTGFPAPQYPADSFPINGSIPVAGIPSYSHAQHVQYANYANQPPQHSSRSGMMAAPDPILVCAHDHTTMESAMCAVCRRPVRPQPQKEFGACTWLAAGACFLLGCWPCACLPFCCDSFKDTVFRCPSCGLELYRVRLP